MTCAALVFALLGGEAGAQSPTVSVNDSSAIETNAGTTRMDFRITCEDVSTTVSYTTSPLTAQAGVDYQHTQGSVNCSPPPPSSRSGPPAHSAQQLTRTFTVPIYGDTLDEADETFRVTVSHQGGSAGDKVGMGTIYDDDAPADSDGDGVPDSSDACPTLAGPAPSGCPAGEDSDGDGVPNASDACPMVAGDGPDGCQSLGLPPPVLGVSANLVPLKGEVYVRLPPGTTAGSPARAAQKGQPGYIPLQQARQVPIGTFVDTENGTVQLSTASNSAGKTQFGNFARGLFQILQRREEDAVTTLRLKGSRASFDRCQARGAGLGATAARRRLSRRTVRRLSSNATGRFRTRGRDSAATVRGTIWVTADRCDGTLTRVKRGRVRVRDFRRRRSILVRAGKSYLAERAP